jgi:hypothetical protein
MEKTNVDLRIGRDHFRIERDSTTGEMIYFLNDVVVTVTVYLARMQHYREIELQRLYGLPRNAQDERAPSRWRQLSRTAAQ